MLKRKQATPPSAPNKRPSTRSKSPIPVGANGQPVEIVPGKGEQVSKVPNVTKQKIGQPHTSITAAVQVEQTVNTPDREAELARTTSGAEAATPQVENISHGQHVLPDGAADGDGSAVSTSTVVSPPKLPVADSKLQKIQGHIVPTHAGWFSWTKVHSLERRGVPEFFNGKSKMKTPELYMEYRNFVIQKYRENPKTYLSIGDIQDLVVGDLNAVRRIIEFLDHWGLINYHCPTGPTTHSHPAWQATAAKVDENNASGELQALPHTVPPVTSLYQFDNLSGRPSSSRHHSHTDPVSALAETVVSDPSPGPDVEYHCNACSADCSKRRYHCQKQADFDLCPDCYNDGKFGAGTAAADFIRMDALSDSNSDDGGWTDQETLLLLEALELYGENWNEIAEHVATKSKAQCILHFIKMPIEDSFLEDVSNATAAAAAAAAASVASVSNLPEVRSPRPENLPETHPETPNGSTSSKSEEPTAKTKIAQQKEDFIVKAIMEASACADGSSENLIAFADAGNPVMAQVAFLAAMVGPRVAAAAAQSALMALSEGDPASQLAAKNTFLLEGPSTIALPPSIERLDGLKALAKDEIPEEESAKNDEKLRSETPSAERIKNAAATALAAAAVKAKLLADQEEREIQRLVASAIENQLKKLEVKLKHFGELEIMLKKEYEQVDRARQRHIAERARLLSSRTAPPSSSSSSFPADTLQVQSQVPMQSQVQTQVQQSQLLQAQSPSLLAAAAASGIPFNKPLISNAAAAAAAAAAANHSSTLVPMVNALQRASSYAYAGSMPMPMPMIPMPRSSSSYTSNTSNTTSNNNNNNNSNTNNNTPL